MDLDAVEKIAPLDLGNIGMRPGAGGADNRLRGKPPLVRHDCKTIAGPFDGFHPDWTLDGEFVTGLIASELIKDVIARGIPLMRGRRHKPTRQRTVRSEEHTSELQSLMRISYAVFCLKKKKQKQKRLTHLIPSNRKIIQKYNKVTTKHQSA